MEKELSFWKIFKIVATKYLPDPDPDKGLLSSRKAEKFLNGELKFMPLIARAEAGYLRVDKKKKFYQEELELLNLVYDVQKLFSENSIVSKIKDFDQKKYWVIVPDEITKLGQSQADQKLNVVAKTLTHPFILELIEELKSQN